MAHPISTQTLLYSAVNASRGSTQYLTTSVPLNSVPKVSNSFIIQPETITQERSSIITPMTSSMQHTPTIVPSMDSSIIDSDYEKENSSVFTNDGHFIWNHKTIMLFFTEYEHHEKKLQKEKYQSKETMFQALAESFKEKGYVNATKNHMKNKFKLLKKKWDKYIKRTMEKNSTGKNMKSLPYEDEMIKIFGKSYSAVPPFVAGRKEIVSQKEIVERISQTLSQNRNEKQSSIESHIPLPILPVTSSDSEHSSSFMMNSNSTSLLNTRAKVQDGKLARTLQSVNDSICTVLKNESDAKQETRIKLLTELEKCNELQKERNFILQKQLQVLERIEKKMYLTQKEISDEDF